MFFLTDEHKMMRRAVSEFAEKEIAPKAAEIDRTCEFPRETFEKMGKLGLLGIPYPEEWGGAGADYLSYAIAVEEVAKYCCASGLMLLLSALPTHPILIGGSEQQKKAWLPRSASGEAKGAFCLTEPNAGSDATALESRRWSRRRFDCRR